MSIFTFDAVNHIYYLDGVRIPGVTSVLKSAGLVQSYGGFGDTQLRGLHVHYACELMDLNDLDWSTVYPQWMGYVQAYQKFREDTGFEPQLIEFQSYHPVYRFAGTMDRRGSMNGRMWQIDLKTGAPSDWWSLQTAGYQLLEEREWAEDGRASLQLNENGTYRLHIYEDEGDRGVFLAALALYYWKSNHKIKEAQA